MVEQSEKLAGKLKSKRQITGTPLHRLATKIGLTFAASLGCVHVGLMYLTYNADVPDEYLTGGIRQSEIKAVQLGMIRDDYHPLDRLEGLKDELKRSTDFGIFATAYYFIQSKWKKYFSEEPEDSVTANVTEKGMPSSSPVVGKVETSK